MVEWIGEALEFIGASVIFDPAIAFIEVKNHQCVLPKHLYNILQIARNYSFIPVTPAEVQLSSSETPSQEQGPDTPVRIIDASGMPVDAYELASYRPYFDLIGEYYIGGIPILNQRKFSPVHLANHSFFNTIVCKEQNFTGISHSHTDDEYTLIGNVARFSFESGQVAVSYLRYKIDCEDGYPMIPDHISYTTAITAYIKMRLSETDFYAQRQGSQALLQKAELDWQWYCKQASNQGKMPQSIDDWENLLNQRNYLLPRINRYDSFFGNLSEKENLKMIGNGR